MKIFIRSLTLAATAALMLLLTTSCNRTAAYIEGTIEGANGQQVFLKKNIANKIVALDSARLDQSGRFRFKIAKPDPIDFFHIVIDSMPTGIAVLLRPSESIELNMAAQNMVASCTSKGSADMALMLELQQHLAQTKLSLDSLLRSDSLARKPKDLRLALGRLFIRQKRFNTTFIVKNITSPSCILAYTQRLQPNVPLFGMPDDRFLLRTLTDSLRVRYPKSTYVNMLLLELDDLNLQVQQASLQAMLANAPELDKPEVALPDTAGNLWRLDELTGKVVLLSFWVSTNSLCLMDNRELLDIYHDFHAQGFEIFQVSIDDDEAQWRQAVAEHRLPWISVRCDVEEGCRTTQDYVVKKLPATYLIARDGKIVGRDFLGKELVEKIKQQLKK